MSAPLFPDPFAAPPDHVNPEGVKWWRDSLTDYARKPDLNDTCLPGVTVWLVERPDGYRTRLIIDAQGGLEFESQKLEDVAVHIEMMKAAARFRA